MNMPINLILMMRDLGEVISRRRGGRRINVRIIPYEPSFRRIPARTMEPATGASTWAFGNHKWRV